MSPLVGRRVVRMNGAGNKILVLDLRGGATLPTPEEARAINLAPGLDYDQMMVLRDPRSAESFAFVSIYNNDGSLSGACGNGTRCVAERLWRETGMITFRVETERGLIACERLRHHVYRVDMGSPRFGWREIPLAQEVGNVDSVDVLPPEQANFGKASVVNMGNPHVVFFGSNFTHVSVTTFGPRIEMHPLFPQRVNVSFAEVIGRDHIKLRVWERGAGATLACGSAACAALVAGVRRGLTERKAQVDLPGGQLIIEWREGADHVLMTGPVEFEREIELEAAIFAAA